MKLNLDCIRSILLCVEANTGLRKSCVFVDIDLNEAMKFVGDTVEPQDYQNILLKDYSNEEIIYHINYCNKADLISLDESQGNYIIPIFDLTPKGHSFLENIREKKIWTGIKGIASKIGSKSLEAVIQIASNVITELIKMQFSTGIPFQI